MKNLLSSVMAFALLLVSAAAQDQATTLAHLSREAAVVVRATVLAADDPSPEWHRLQFARIEVLKGTVDSQFSLLEPAGACCGRSLFTLQIGDSCLLFLQRRSTALHPLGGARGVLPDLPSVVSHVRALLQGGNDAALAALLAANLANPEPRIATDAAHSLAVIADLTLSPTARTSVSAALQDAVQRSSTTAAPLVEVLVRLHDEAMLDDALPLYLTTPLADQCRLLQKGLARCQPAMVVDRLPLHLGDDTQAAVRAAQLLTRLPAAEARVGLQNMLSRATSARLQLCLAEGLLACGVTGSELRRQLPDNLLQLAQRRLDNPNRFRSIAPRQR